ncbi:unnamed protein product [Tenebrio molitor]|nr:unnamed protein product [Tenebrio molitor]
MQAQLILICLFLYAPWISCSKNSSFKLEFRPLPQEDGGTLIRYKAGNASSYWKQELDKFLKPYTQNNQLENAVACGRDPPRKNQFCHFDIKTIALPCTAEYQYGFGSSSGGPCVFLKPSQISGWVPQCYNSTTVPQDMPENLRTDIIEREQHPMPDVVWVECHGETPPDRENVGPMVYFPLPGFRGVYFPFTGIEGYLSPLVAVHFKKPTRNDTDYLFFQDTTRIITGLFISLHYENVSEKEPISADERATKQALHAR